MNTDKDLHRQPFENLGRAEWNEEKIVLKSPDLETRLKKSGQKIKVNAKDMNKP